MAVALPATSAVYRQITYPVSRVPSSQLRATWDVEVPSAAASPVGAAGALGVKTRFRSPPVASTLNVPPSVFAVKSLVRIVNLLATKLLAVPPSMIFSV